MISDTDPYTPIYTVRSTSPIHMTTFVDSVVVARDWSRNGFQVIVQREYEKIVDIMNAHERVPSWTRFAHARQGIE